MMGCSSATALQQNWRKLAIFLDVWEIVGRLEHKLATNNTDYTGIFADLLMEWKTKQGLNATLGNLVHIFTEQCKWNDVAGKSWSYIYVLIVGTVCKHNTTCV